ncbi:Pyruvate kinase [Dictyocoela muelleri]|nr:Pyruvate kinase [Dictyocoela muelleri]
MEVDNDKDNGFLLRNTKIICSMGPSSKKSKIIKEMLKKGMSVVRYNLSYVDDSSIIAEHIKKINKIRGDNVYPGIAIDTRGPEMRIKNLKKALFVNQGDILTIKSYDAKDEYTQITDDCDIINLNEEENSSELVFYQESSKPLESTKLSEIQKEPENKILVVDQKFYNVEIGSKIKIDDGLLNLKVLNIGKNSIEAVATNGHIVKPNKKVFIEGAILEDTSLAHDKKMLSELEELIDIVFISFANSANDVLEIKKVFKKKKPLLYAKIESEEAMNKLNEIINVSDGIMIARGDLNIAVSFEKLFSTQNKIIRVCKEMCKPVIMATQMLESMIDNKFPKCPEVTDIGSAVVNGCDCVMLSSESSLGNNPVECVEIMRAICTDAEATIVRGKHVLGIVIAILLTNKWEHLVQFLNCGLPIILCSTNIELLRKATILKDVNPLYVNEETFLDYKRVVAKVKDYFKLKGIKSGIYYGDEGCLHTFYNF